MRLNDATIDIGTVDIAQTYNVTPPARENGGMVGFQSDVNGNLKVSIAGAEIDTTISARSIRASRATSPGV